MADFKQETGPAQLDPNLVWTSPYKDVGRDAALQEPPRRELQPGDQYIDPRSGSVVTVLSPEKQAEVDRAQSNQRREALLSSLEGHRDALGRLITDRPAFEAVVTERRAELNATTKLADNATADDVFNRRQVKERLAAAEYALEMSVVTERTLRRDIGELKSQLRAV
jgi:hypothetical protein